MKNRTKSTDNFPFMLMNFSEHSGITNIGIIPESDPNFYFVPICVFFVQNFKNPLKIMNSENVIGPKSSTQMLGNVTN